MRISIVLATILNLILVQFIEAKAVADDPLTRLLDNQQLKTRQSIQFLRLSDGKTLFKKNPDQLLIPASATKLLIGAAALIKFKPNHRFKTPFYYSGRRLVNTIKGDLIVVGQGDPYITSEKLWQLSVDLKHLNIKEFEGDLLIDNSLFDGRGYDRPRQSGKNSSEHAYDAPISAFGVNFNTIAVALAPAPKNGSLALAAMDPYPLPQVKIQNRIRTASSQAGSRYRVVRQTKKNVTEITLNGQIAKDKSIEKIYRSISRHVSTAGEQIKAFLKAAGIKIKGKVKEAELPKKASLLYELEGFPMSKIVAGLNQFSNNYIADVMLKRLGVIETKKGSGSYENGLKFLEKFMRHSLGIRSSFVIENGSGLNVNNRLSAEQLVRLLQHMESRMDVFPEFFASLPAAGWNGTLKDRFNLKETKFLQGQIRAKTGTLSEPVTVVSLAGYLRHPRHGLVAFAIIENGVSKKPQPSIMSLRERQDRVLARFMQYL